MLQEIHPWKYQSLSHHSNISDVGWSEEDYQHVYDSMLLVSIWADPWSLIVCIILYNRRNTESFFRSADSI